MTSLALDFRPDPQALASERPAAPVAPARLPHIAIRAFCEDEAMIAAVEAAAADRRFARARCAAVGGGLEAAIAQYQAESTPDVVLVQSNLDGPALLAALDRFAAVCDAATKVIVIGRRNDIQLYRELIDRGVADYLVAPVDALQIVSAVAALYRGADAQKLGRIAAFIGAKGGVGSSTIAQNVAWTLSRAAGSEVLLADLDVPFGSAGLNFNVESGRGVVEALSNRDRLDENFLERLLTRRGEHLRLLIGEAALEELGDLPEDGFDRVLEVAQASFPYVLLDVPHSWTAWVKKTLLMADEIVLVTTPDLMGLRNARNLIALLARLRPNDGPPKLVLNQVGMPRRSEIKPAEFAAALDMEIAASIAFDAQTFSFAATSGRMIGETAPRAAAGRSFDLLAQAVSGRPEPPRARGLGALLARLRRP